MTQDGTFVEGDYYDQLIYSYDASTTDIEIGDYVQFVMENELNNYAMYFEAYVKGDGLYLDLERSYSEANYGQTYISAQLYGTGLNAIEHYRVYRESHPTEDLIIRTNEDFYHDSGDGYFYHYYGLELSTAIVADERYFLELTDFDGIVITYEIETFKDRYYIGGQLPLNQQYMMVKMTNFSDIENFDGLHLQFYSDEAMTQKIAVTGTPYETDEWRTIMYIESQGPKLSQDEIWYFRWENFDGSVTEEDLNIRMDGDHRVKGVSHIAPELVNKKIITTTVNNNQEAYTTIEIFGYNLASDIANMRTLYIEDYETDQEVDYDILANMDKGVSMSFSNYSFNGHEVGELLKIEIPKNLGGDSDYIFKTDQSYGLSMTLGDWSNTGFGFYINDYSITYSDLCTYGTDYMYISFRGTAMAEYVDVKIVDLANPTVDLINSIENYYRSVSSYSTHMSMYTHLTTAFEIGHQYAFVLSNGLSGDEHVEEILPIRLTEREYYNYTDSFNSNSEREYIRMASYGEADFFDGLKLVYYYDEAFTMPTGNSVVLESDDYDYMLYGYMDIVEPIEEDEIWYFRLEMADGTPVDTQEAAAEDNTVYGESGPSFDMEYGILLDSFFDDNVDEMHLQVYASSDQAALNGLTSLRFYMPDTNEVLCNVLGDLDHGTRVVSTNIIRNGLKYGLVLDFYIDKDSYPMPMDTNIHLEIYGAGSNITYGITFDSDSVNPEPPTLGDEDVNGDGLLDMDDMDTLADDYNVSQEDSAFDSKRDFNNDGIIDLYDLMLLSRMMAE